MPAVATLPMFVALLAAAAEPTTGPQVLVEFRPAAAETETNDVVGARIWVDPTTGALTATRPDGVAPPTLKAASLVDEGEDLVPFELNEGGRGLRLAGRFQHAAIAVVGADGALSWRCAAGDDHSAESTSNPAEPR